MKQRKDSYSPAEDSHRGGWFRSLKGRPKRRRPVWTFEQLEARHYFSTNPVVPLPNVETGLEGVQFYAISNSTPEGQQLIDALSLAWAAQSAGQSGPVNAAPRSLPTDPGFNNQWHLLNVGQAVTFRQVQNLFGLPGQDINVVPAWESGATGEGVLVAVVDTGVELNHPDLDDNIDLQFAYNALLGSSSNVGPSSNTAAAAHGTAVAGLIGALADNGLGGVGVAPDASIVPIKLIPTSIAEPFLTTAAIARAFTANGAPIDIFNHSWGPTDAGLLGGDRGVDALSVEELIALTNSARFGRNGLGSIHVFAAGNGAEAFDSAGSDGYVNSRYTIGVGMVDHDGTLANSDGTTTLYGEMAPSVLVVAPSGSGPYDIIHNFDLGSGIFTTDLSDGGLNIPPPTQGGNEIDNDFYPDTAYTTQFGGTSAAAPLVSGVIALMLEVNPNLTYRDVQEILVRSARQNDDDDQSWIVNSIPLFRDPIPHDPLPPNYEEGGAYPIDEDFWGDEIIYEIVPAMGEDGEPMLMRDDNDPPNPNNFDYTNYHPIANPLTRPAPLSLFTNGAGYTVSYGRNPASATEYGYAHGVIDASLAVELARQWTLKNQHLPPEKTFLVTSVAGIPIKAAGTTSEDTGEFLIPGALSNAEDDFIPFFEEFFKEPTITEGDPEADPPTMDAIDPESLPFRGDDPPANTRGAPIQFTMPLVDPVTGAPNQMSIEWVEIHLSISGDPDAFNNLRVTLVSPSGTHSELTLQQYRPEDINKSFQSIPVNLFVDPVGSITPSDETGNHSDTLDWVYSTNRHWGERADGVWSLYFENYSPSELQHNESTIVFHGTPIGSPADFVGRVSGNVGVDSGRFNSTINQTTGDRDQDFNFNRYLAIGTDPLTGEPVLVNPNGPGVEFRSVDITQEPFASNVTVNAYLVDPDTQERQLVDQFITGADGNFYFDLPVGDYVFEVEDALGRTALDGQTSEFFGFEDFKSEWFVTVDDPFGAIADINFLLDPGDLPINEVVFVGQVSGDLNGNGVKDPQDAGVTNFQVFADLNHSNQFEIGEPFTVTDSDGTYELRVPTGTPNTFSIGVKPLTGWTQTSPVSGPHVEYAQPGDTVEGVDFLFAPPSTPTGDGNGTVFGFVFDDRNGDGQQQKPLGENGASGFTIFIDADLNGDFDQGEVSTTTDASGGFQFGNLIPGTYRIAIVAEEPFALTAPEIGYFDVTLTAGEVAKDKHFGVQNLATHSYGTLVGPGYKTNGEDAVKHFVVPGFSLGSSVQPTVRPQNLVENPPDSGMYEEDPSLSGQGGDGIVVVGGTLRPGANLIEVTVNGVGGILNGWFDFYGAGDFDGAGAHPASWTDVDLNPGTHQLVLIVPDDVAAGQMVAARFRWGTPGLDYFGGDLIGEVEDYMLAVVVPAPGDYDGDGMIGSGDYALWKSTYGSTVDLRADGNGDGRVDAGDYVFWRNQLAASQPLGGGGGGLAAPLAAPVSDPVTAAAPPPNLAGLQFSTLVATPGSSLDEFPQADSPEAGTSNAELLLLDSVLGALAEPADDDPVASTLATGENDDTDSAETLAAIFDEVTDWRFSL